MTSGNLSEEPIVIGQRGGAASAWPAWPTAFLLHDRDIHMRVDDSVVRAFGGASGCCGARAATRRLPVDLGRDVARGAGRAAAS